jgi:tRNA A-37 threonylcarbamoyl transferase component Bud32
MKRMVVAIIAALATVALVAPAGQAAPATANISVAFSSDFLSADITSTKGVSHYDVVLCDKSLGRVELSGDDKTVTAGPYDAQILSISVKSATTKTTFYSGYTGECKKPEPPKK